MERFQGQTLILCDSDLDGSMSRTFFEHFLQDKPDLSVLQSTIKEVDEFLKLQDLSKVETIVFADLAPSREVMDTLLQNHHRQVYLFDHHPTTREALVDLTLLHIEGNKIRLSATPNFIYIYDVGRCSAKLVHDFFSDKRDDAAAEFAHLVDVYDRWQDEHSDFDKARGLSNLLYWYLGQSRLKGKHIGYEKFIKAQLKKLQLFKRFEFFDYEQEAVDKSYVKEQEYLKKARKNVVTNKDSDGHTFGYFEQDSKISYCCSMMLKEHPEFDYVICHSTWKVNGEETDRCSMRTKEDRGVSVKSKAERFKGGGHLFASGIALPYDVRHDLNEGRGLEIPEYIDDIEIPFPVDIEMI